jgi:predicted GH43/DUF377 family glycosyl hydrolase
MKMKWIKKGHIYSVDQPKNWMHSHAQCPTAIVLEDTIRVFFSARYPNQQSLPTYIDVDINDPTKIIKECKIPVLDFGRKGTFDENGIIPSYFIEKDKSFYFYYAGWSKCKNVPYKNFTGLAISEDNGESFTKYKEAPVFSLDENNPLSATGPCIIKREDDFISIYSTGIDWIEINGKLEHTYLLTYATSKDAINWKGTGEIIIKPERDFMAHCKPTIIFEDGFYHMWFSKRGSNNFRQAGEDSYRLGYAFSKDLINWTRDDSKVGIDVSQNGWDSEMICYPHIVKAKDKYFMFYNGNGFGKSGFGYAELEISKCID